MRDAAQMTNRLSKNVETVPLVPQSWTTSDMPDFFSSFERWKLFRFNFLKFEFCLLDAKKYHCAVLNSLTDSIDCVWPVIFKEEN